MRTVLFSLPLLGCIAAGPTPPPPPTAMRPAAAPIAQPAALPAASNGCSAPDVTDDRAAAVETAGRIDGCFENAGGLDWYRYVVPGDRLTRVWIDLTGATGSVSTFLMVENADAKRLGVAMVTPGKSERLELIAEPGAVVFFKAYANSDPQPSWPWSATFTTEPADLDEPNDAPEIATPLVLGEPRVAALTPRLKRDGELINDAADFYVIEVKTPGRLRVAIDEVGRTISPELQLTTPGGKLVRGPNPPGPSKPVEMAVDVAAGRHVIRLRHGTSLGARAVSVSEKDAEQYPLAPRYRITATLEAR